MPNNPQIPDVQFNDPTPSAMLSCPPGSSDCVNPPCLAISNIDVSTLRVINTPTFQNQEMDVAINNATDNINETADGNRSTIMLLKEILDYNLTNPTQEEVRVLDYSIRTIQMALANLQLLKTEVSDTIEVESYFTATLQLLDNKIAQAVAENNYYHHVYLMFDKACVQHLHGDRMAAISTIEQIQLFASAEEVDYLAYWHCLYDLENQAITGVITKEEYTNTLEMCAPPQYLRVMNISENQQEREVKHNPYHFNVDNTNSMAQLKFNSQIAENTTISVYDLSGKIVSSQSFDTQKGENNFVINLANLSKSIYVVQFKVNENVCREKVGLY
ncbi:MAG: T9SS type A sorting domain-containing protein [Bacteroidetes bacterium]|nr:T9SS type A sorting domain-containing protein [Bacteroidota bacterium]